MSSRALLLGDPGNEPFSGHLRFEVPGETWIAVAGRVAASDGLRDAFRCARHLEGHLHRALHAAANTADRNALLRCAWQALADLDAASLGSSQGADLSLLLVAGDARGVGVAGTGLGAVWAAFPEGWEPLATGTHPLLQTTGRPERPPGVITLREAPRQILGSPQHLPARLPDVDAIPARAGVRR